MENWKKAYKNKHRLLLFGDVGIDKSFFAECIANAILEQDVPMLIINFSYAPEAADRDVPQDKADFIASFDEYDLIIINDFGVEHST